MINLPVRSRALVLAWLVAVALLSCCLLALTYVVAVHTRRGRLVDGASFRGAAQSRSSLTLAVERLLDVVSVSTLLTALLVVVTIALLRSRRDVALAAAAVIVGSTVTTQVLKQLVLTRPDLGIVETTPATLNSMPSGHATTALCVSVALVLVVPPPLRPVAAVTGVVYSALAAIATLSAGWHRPSDALAGFFVVTAWAALAEAVVVLRAERPGPDDATHPGAQPLATSAGQQPASRAAHASTALRLGMAAAALLGSGTVIAVAVVLSGADPYRTPAQVASYVAAGLVIGGVAAAAMGAVIAALGEVVPETGSPEASARASGLGRARTGWLALGGVVVVLGSLLVFVLQNGRRVAVRFLGLEVHVALGVALLVAALIGAVLAVVVTGGRVLLRRRDLDDRAAETPPDVPTGNGAGPTRGA